MITKSETRMIFDRAKVGVGDIVEFNEYKARLFGPEKVNYRVAGIVTKVQADCLWVSTRDEYDIYNVRNFGLPVERAAEITVIVRHPANKEAE